MTQAADIAAATIDRLVAGPEPPKYTKYRSRPRLVDRLRKGEVELVDRFLREVMGWEAYITNGLEGRMPPLNENLTVPERWDVVNFVRTLKASE